MPEREHVFANRQKKDAIISCIHLELIKGARWVKGEYEFSPLPEPVTSPDNVPLILDLFKRAKAEFEHYGPYRDSILRTIVLDIWLLLSRQWSGEGKLQIDRRVEKMIRYMQYNLAVNITRQDLAREFHLTPEHINYMFKKELGISPTQFLHQEKSKEGYRLIRQEGLSVKETASRLGFADPFHFSKVFKKVFGYPPGEVRWR
jgi:AraC-like DNA-binding protein